MNSFWMPKKQPLYMPMLGTFGGGSARGFGHGIGGKKAYGYFGAEYDGWEGDRIDIDFSSFINDTATSPWDSLDGFVSHNLGHFYAAYGQAAHFVFTNAGTSFSGAANYYSVGDRTNFGIPATNVADIDRGITVAYLGDRTPVLIGGKNTSGIIGILERDATAAGGFTYHSSGSLSDVNTDLTSLDWDGTHLLAHSRQEAFVKAYTLPNSLSDGFADLQATYTWTIPSNIAPADMDAGYGGAYLGQDDQGYRYYVSQDTSGTLHRWRLDPIDSGTFGIINLGSINASALGTSWYGYSFAVDFKHRNLLQGAHNNEGRWTVWSE